MKKKSDIIARVLKDKGYLKNNDLIGDYDHPIIVRYKEFYEESITLTDILKDKKFLKENKARVENMLRADYTDYLYDWDDESLEPKSNIKTNYVGIELECFTRYDRLELLEQITANGLDKYIRAGEDGSINGDFGEDVELRMLIPEKQLSTVLAKIGKFLKKTKFGINDTCGLHVHLDMRNRNVEKCYERLLKFQDILFGMVDSDRWYNEYCAYTTIHNIGNRHVAINRNAYTKHKTLEVRLHQATLDVKQIEKWVKLLLNVIGSEAPPPEPVKAEVVKWGRKQKGLAPYISKFYSEDWIEEKKASGEWDF